MKKTAKGIFFFLLLVAAFIFGLNSKKVVASCKKKWTPPQEEKVWAVLEHKPFVVVIPSYNNERWVNKNLTSVLEQKYDNFRILYIDDASTDTTLQKVKEICADYPGGAPYEIWSNPSNRGASENIYRAVMSCEEGEIVVMVDGDDWLAHDRVLERLNEVYADPDVWMTCGTYLKYLTYAKGEAVGHIPKEVMKNNSLRSYVQTKYPLSHLKTFYTALFKKVRWEDFQIEGHFFDCTSDMAMMVPMAEMASHHYRHIPDILYIYNCISPIHDEKIRRARQIECMQEICSRPPYCPISHLFPSEKREHLVKR